MESEKLKGQVERITYYNEENNYSVLKVKVYGYSDLVTVVGNIASPTPGEVLSMTGEWIKHPQFGEQFKVGFYSTSVPATVVGIEKYLGGGLIKGIGPKMAKRIVSIFGEETLEIIENSSERLHEVEGIGKYRVDMIAKAWAEQKEIRTVMVFLQSNGVSSAYASKIYKKYGNDSIKVVKENPYRLAHDVSGIGFVTADKIAQNLGFDEHSVERAEAGIMFTLQEATEEGHVFYIYEELVQKAKEKLNIEEEIIEKAIELLSESGSIHIEKLKKENEEIQAVYLGGYHLSEVRLAKILKEIGSTPSSLKKIYADVGIRYVQKKLQISLAEQQIEAVKSGITNKITIITGSPGTGKTTITKAILEILTLITDKILLAAPTGRAAKRMSEATGREAKTIHRLLEFDPINGGFKHNEENPIDCEVIIIDECSMIDNLLAYHLVKSIPKNAVVILIGDTNQLPSVGAGNVLKDIINSQAFPVIELNEIFRQAKTSKIITNAHKIIHGEYPEMEGSREGDFFFISEEDSTKIVEKIVTMVKNSIPSKFHYDAVNDIQVLTPMNKGNIGTTGLNEALQNALNPNGFEINKFGRRFREGDKVMQIKNNYNKEVYNGDIGFIKHIDTENQSIIIEVDGNVKNYDYSELDELVLAYAVSIHKSQGSEYPVVVMPLSMTHYLMLQRNLVYTGITRGKKLVIVIGSKKAMYIAVKNNKVENRNTWLEKRLSN